MTITRFNHIKNHRIFQDFAWHSDLADFERYNLIYGWNGSGKSTLSNLFRCLEKKEPLPEGDAELTISGKRHLLSGITKESILPQVRVFNRQFITANVFASDTSTSDLAPIYFLGEDSVEKQKRIQTLNAELASENKSLAKRQDSLTRGNAALETFCSDRAKEVKTLLRSSGTNLYNDYDKRVFKATSIKIAKLPDSSTKLLSDEEHAKLIHLKGSQAKAELAKLLLPDPGLAEFTLRAKSLLKETAVSKTIATLLNNSAVARWVEQGILLHTADNASKTCRFCDQLLPLSRVQELQSHFNDEYKKLVRKIDDELLAVSATVDKIRKLGLPEQATLYDHLAVSYKGRVGEWQVFVQIIDAFAGTLISALSDKKARIFEEVSLEVGEAPTWENGETILREINKIIQQHNEQTEGFEASISAARRRLEEHQVASNLKDYKSKSNAIENDEKTLKHHRARVKEINEEIERLKLEIEEHRRPAEQLNEDLTIYLGHDQLKFKIKDAGYSLTREGVPASNLSEGERTAIAFLYFLKSLQDTKFELKKGVVVIDDPVSSLDSNALFSAFAFMKERTQDAGQLFVLTHNFAMFREVKHWLHKGLRGPDRKKRRFYMLTPYLADGHRYARLEPLDRLLRHHQSEYHYLFKKIHDEANKKGTRELADFYPLPNIARRLVESFLAFRYPASLELLDQMKSSTLDPTKRTRLYRFLNTYSHREVIEEQQHDLTLLAQTPQILLDLLEFMAIEDKKHFDEMIKAVGSAEDDD
jgi:wobble nucleotide-excising tRNase